MMSRRLQIQELVTGGHLFVIGSNRVGERLTEYASPVWTDWLDRSTGVEAARGSDTSDLNSLDVGLLSAQFLNLDPTAVTPGQGVRVANHYPPLAVLVEASSQTVGTVPFTGDWATVADVGTDTRLTSPGPLHLTTTTPADADADTTVTFRIAVSAAAAAGTQFTAPRLPEGWTASHTGTVAVTGGFTYTATGPARSIPWPGPTWGELNTTNPTTTYAAVNPSLTYDDLKLISL